MWKKAKGRVNVDDSGRIIGTGGIAATLHGAPDDIIDVLDRNNKKIGEISFGEYMAKRKKGKIW